MKDLLKPPSRKSSTNRKTAFADPLETTCVDSTRPFTSSSAAASRLSEISNCQTATALSVSSQHIAADGESCILLVLLIINHFCRHFKFDKRKEKNQNILQHNQKKTVRLVLTLRIGKLFAIQNMLFLATRSQSSAMHNRPSDGQY